MLDPGALGTLMIGLESVRQEQELGDTPRLRQRRTARASGLRVAVAAVLRRLADLVEPARRTTSPNRA